jgi:hypothetical protein
VGGKFSRPYCGLNAAPAGVSLRIRFASRKEKGKREKEKGKSRKGKGKRGKGKGKGKREKGKGEREKLKRGDSKYVRRKLYFSALLPTSSA